MPQDIPLACACGRFKAVIHAVSAKVDNRVICYCIDCQAAPRHLGHAGRILDAKGGTDLLHTQPNRFEITEGTDQLAVLRLGPKGLNRWYAACCNTPVATTPGGPKFSFVGVATANLAMSREAVDAALGPVRLRYKPEQAMSEVTEPKGSGPKFILRTLRNVLKARLSGSWKVTPFFDVETGRSVLKPYVLSEAERTKAYQA